MFFSLFFAMIGDYAFNNSEGLTSINILEKVTSIGKYAFTNCTNLTSITRKAITPPSIRSAYTFYNVDTSIPVYVPFTSLSDYQTARAGRPSRNRRRRILKTLWGCCIFLVGSHVNTPCRRMFDRGSRCRGISARGARARGCTSSS